MKPRRIEVNDLMQQGYVYLLTEPAGENFHPDFHPELTPSQMLELGVFGGKYMTDCAAEFPADWFGKVKMVIQCIAIGIVLGLFAFDWPEPLRKFLTIAAHVFVWGTLLTTVGSGTSYVLKTRKLLEKSTQPV